MHPVILKAYLEEFLKGVEEKEAMGRTLEFLTRLSIRRPLLASVREASQ